MARLSTIALLLLLVVLAKARPLTPRRGSPLLPAANVIERPLSLLSPPASSAYRRSPKPLWSTNINLRENDIKWLRLKFGPRTYLRPASDNNTAGDVIKLTSLSDDDAIQYLDNSTIAHWKMYSAYFNGRKIRVELFAPTPVDEEHSPTVELLSALTNDGSKSMPLPPTSTLCNERDSRVPSTDMRTARLQPVGCTVWSINDAGHCYLSAGHCFEGADSRYDQMVIQYNLPESVNGNGRYVAQHPLPEDQYPIDISSLQYNQTDTDWAYFGVHASNNHTTPFEAYGGVSFLLPPKDFEFPEAGSELRLTGNGIDKKRINLALTQQTSTGKLTGYGEEGAGHTVQYRIDSEGGNSGSAVEDVTSGYAIGIHTTGGCRVNGPASSNYGTLVSDEEIQRALRHPQGVCRVSIDSIQ